MPEYNPQDIEFLALLQRVVEENVADENFGVSELANAINMSRSNLLRRLKKSTGKSVSVFIRQVRLKKAMEMLKNSSQNISEISYAVGFSSTSYFIKCFREEYGFPPGEANKRIQLDSILEEVLPVKGQKRSKNALILAMSLLTVLLVVIGYYVIRSTNEPRSIQIEKSIAVLPFKNDSNDSSNIYLINGLMESTLNNLQKINDLRVVSRTSTEKFRNSIKTIPEIAKELNVSYFVEGSGQKIGDKILLNVQLIEAATDKQLWAKKYSREVTSLFELQEEIAKSIANEVQAIITPLEKVLIEKAPTDNLEAYDYFLKAYDLFEKRTNEDHIKAIPLFEKAIALDEEFALAHAVMAINYYYLDIFKQKKEYLNEINIHSDKALLYDSKLAQSLMSKALYYLHNEEYSLAAPYLEKALEYNPNSAAVINLLSSFYSTYSPNTEKYLEYALKGVQLNVAAYDSMTASYIYLNLSNALIQTGFVDEALKYVDVSLSYFESNPFSNYVKAYMLYAKNHDWAETRKHLFVEWKKDTSRLDILQDLAKSYYFNRDFDSANYYYERFIKMREVAQLDIYRHEHATIALVFEEVGKLEESKRYFADYLDFFSTDQSIYKNLALSVYYAHLNDFKKSIEYLELFSKEDNYMYWVVLFPNDPLVDKIQDSPEHIRLMKKIEDKFWENHRRLRKTLEDKDLLESSSLDIRRG